MRRQPCDEADVVILKFTYNQRLDADCNISVSGETITDTEGEAEEAGEAFFKLMQAFVNGYGNANPDAKGKGS